MKITKSRLKEIIKEELGSLSENDDKVSKKISYLMDKEGKPQKQAVAMALDMEERGKLEEGFPGAELVSQFIGFIQQNPEVAIAAISANAAALGIAEMLETIADKVRDGLANRESDMMKEDDEGDADEAFIQSSQLGRADAADDEAADRNSEEDEGYQANRAQADSDKDYVRAYEAERRKDALVLKGPKEDPLGDSLAARRLRAIARRKAGDK